MQLNELIQIVCNKQAKNFQFTIIVKDATISAAR